MENNCLQSSGQGTRSPERQGLPPDPGLAGRGVCFAESELRRCFFSSYLRIEIENKPPLHGFQTMRLVEALSTGFWSLPLGAEPALPGSFPGARGIRRSCRPFQLTGAFPSSSWRCPQNCPESPQCFRSLSPS